MTNIDGHSLVDCGGLWWLGAISSVLPMCHVHVAVFVLGCDATYISVIPKIPKKSHKFFGSYLCQICKKPSLPSSKIIQQYSFSYSVQNNTLWRKYHFGMSKWYPFSIVLSYAQITILHQMPAQSIHYFEPSFNIRSYVQCGTLQSKYHQGSSFWAENLWRRSS